MYKKWDIQQVKNMSSEEIVSTLNSYSELSEKNNYSLISKETIIKSLEEEICIIFF